MIDVPAASIPGFHWWLTWGVGLGCLIVAARHAPWRTLAVTRRQRVYLGAGAGILLLWGVRAGISPGLEIHFLGVTTLTLMFGWELALIMLAAVSLGLGLAGLEPWHAMAMNYVVSGIVPVAVSWGVYRWAENRLPNHFFVYLFVCVFFAAILSDVAMSAALTLLLVATDTYGFERIAHEYLGFLPLFALPEAVLNGFIMTGMLVLRPEWVCTFDDARYLKGK